MGPLQQILRLIPPKVSEEQPRRPPARTYSQRPRTRPPMAGFKTLAPANVAVATAATSPRTDTSLRTETSRMPNPRFPRGGLPYLERRNHTKQPPMKLEKAKKGNYWIYEYQFDEIALYTMRCPSPSCQHPVFSRDPLEAGRAAKHLRACGLHFKDEKDMVIRYGHLGLCIHLCAARIQLMCDCKQCGPTAGIDR